MGLFGKRKASAMMSAKSHSKGKRIELEPLSSHAKVDAIIDACGALEKQVALMEKESSKKFRASHPQSPYSAADVIAFEHLRQENLEALRRHGKKLWKKYVDAKKALKKDEEAIGIYNRYADHEKKATQLVKDCQGLGIIRRSLLEFWSNRGVKSG